MNGIAAIARTMALPAHRPTRDDTNPAADGVGNAEPANQPLSLALGLAERRATSSGRPGIELWTSVVSGLSPNRAQAVFHEIAMTALVYRCRAVLQSRRGN